MIDSRAIQVFTFACSLLFASSGNAQNLGILSHPPNGLAFPDNELPQVHIQCGDALDWMLTEENWYANIEHPATFIYQSSAFSDTIENVGFRLRGNTSRSAPKKSFKVSFNTFDESGAWLGLQKLNLNGEHNDPSIIRSRLAWECLRDAGVPVSRSQHVKMYINGSYFGVYVNTEHIDAEWLERRFQHAHGNLWKCTYPANLEFISNNPDAYKFTPSWSNQRVYELKTNKLADDYSALSRFIAILNNTPIAELPCAIEDVFDVDAYLKTLAGEILFGHWDNYVGNQNNFYLYERSTDGRLMYIPYDMDNTLGIQWFGEWTDQNMYNWTEAGDRPLYTRLLEIPEYRSRLTWYFDWWMGSLFDEEWAEGRGSWLIDLLSEGVATDSYYPLSYGFSIEDFENSVTDAWGSHVAHSISNYVAVRNFWAEVQLEAVGENEPIVQCWAEGPALNDSITVDCWIPEHFDFNPWAMELSYSTGEMVSAQALEFEGSTSNGQAWSTTFGLNGVPFIDWQVFISHPSGATSSSPCAPRRVWNSHSEIAIRINEVMPLNSDFHADEAGNFGDWVELLNVGSTPLNTNGLYLTNRLMEPNRWKLPGVTLDPGQHLLIWCDDETDLSPLHASFTLSANNDEVYVMHKESDAWRIVDAIDWENAAPNASLGRTFDGADEWIWFHTNADNPPTPNGPNGQSSDQVLLDELKGWKPQSPCNQPCRITLPCETEWRLYDLSGAFSKQGKQQEIYLNELAPGLHILQWADRQNSIRRHKIVLQ